METNEIKEVKSFNKGGLVATLAGVVIGVGGVALAKFVKDKKALKEEEVQPEEDKPSKKNK